MAHAVPWAPCDGNATVPDLRFVLKAVMSLRYIAEISSLRFIGLVGACAASTEHRARAMFVSGRAPQDPSAHLLPAQGKKSVQSPAQRRPSTTQTSFWYRENMGADGPKKYCEVSVSYRVSILKVSSNYPQILLRRQNSFQETI